MLAAHSITKRYPNGTEALRGVSLSLARGVTAGLAGESGCGKSTLARILCRLEEPSGGRVTLDGGAGNFRKRVQIVFQDASGALDPRATVEQSLREPLENFFRLSRAETARRVSELLNSVGLGGDLLKRRPHQCSGGQRQRVAIARALAAEPEYLICDEAVSGIDADASAQITALLRSLCRERGMGCLFITHDLELAREICDAIYHMRAGALAMTDAPEFDALDYAYCH
jgi:ABC-type glutathione transport system ATPase component